MNSARVTHSASRTEKVYQKFIDVVDRVPQQRGFANPRLEHGLELQACRIMGVGAYLPAKILTNAQIGRQLADDGEWIFSRTGIRERRIADDDEFTSDLATRASLNALSNAGLKAEDVELIIVATNTPDMAFPATACLVQAKIGAPKCPAIDLKAGGAGFIYALEVGRRFIVSRAVETVLVIGAEKLSSVIDWGDRNTCALFGDGAGAVVLRRVPSGTGVIATYLGSNGTGGDLLTISGGGSRIPASIDSVAHGLHFLRMQGAQTFKAAVTALCEAANEALRQSCIKLGEIDCIIPHQSNGRIIETFARRLRVQPGQLFLNLEHCGNTSAASIPIALAEAIELGRIKSGDFVLLVGFGSGLTSGASVIQW